MKPTPRKLGDPIPERLLLKPDGTLAMADGSDPAAYLKTVRRVWGVRGTVPVCLVGRDAMQQLETEAFLHRNHSA